MTDKTDKQTVEESKYLAKLVPYGVSADFDLRAFQRSLQLAKQDGASGSDGGSDDGSSDGTMKASSSKAKHEDGAPGVPGPEPVMRVNARPATGMNVQPIGRSFKGAEEVAKAAKAKASKASKEAPKKEAPKKEAPKKEAPKEAPKKVEVKTEVKKTDK